MCLILFKITGSYVCTLRKNYNLKLNFKHFLTAFFESLTRAATCFSPTLMSKHFQRDCTYFKNLKSQKHVTLTKFNKRQPQMECKISFNLSVITSEWEREPPGAESILLVISVMQLFKKYNYWKMPLTQNTEYIYTLYTAIS